MKISALRAPARDDTGSIPLLMLATLLGVLLSAAMMPILLDMRTTTNFDVTRVRDLNAAQAGTDVMIGHIRNAVDASGAGQPSSLPCTTLADGSGVAALTGVTSVGDGGDRASYSVTVQYYVADPVAHPTTVAMRCVPGHGPYDVASQSVVPSYARIVSVGTDTTTNSPGSSKGRTLSSVYSLEVDNSNISGGIIRIYPYSNETVNWCMDAGSDTPAEGAAVTLQQCSTAYPPTAQQTFAYRSDLTLQLVSSIGTTVSGTTYRTGLCIDVATRNSYGTAPASGSALVLKQCGALGSAVWSQQWAFDTYAAFQAPTSASAGNGSLSGLCMTVGGTTVHSAGPITLAACIGTFPTPVNTWVASPAAGAGAATNPASQQFINFLQFGECIHDPRADTAAPYLIAGSCMQNPNLASVGANQKLSYAAISGIGGLQLYYTYSGVTWCLYSQRPAATDTNVLNHRILLTRCSTHTGVTTDKMQWTRTTPASDPSIPYSQQYRFQDADGQCMSLADLSAALYYQLSGSADPYPASGGMPSPGVPGAYDPWKKLVTARCDGSTMQQWNASNNVGYSSVQNIGEN
ncbi:MAG TPA: RICIN domain-containing protein [Jatrophihabitans sp.]|jgi:hypothetical protein|uniref:RICIN domain-containing protein n=1 Tax=Jatrophihabitans sp. TaxID=1932789 RepID=UPI002DF73D9E|nr:RICIN domain-containing protein [Jatrophihabitans sp.]